MAKGSKSFKARGPVGSGEFLFLRKQAREIAAGQGVQVLEGKGAGRVGGILLEGLRICQARGNGRVSPKFSGCSGRVVGPSQQGMSERENPVAKPQYLTFLGRTCGAAPFMGGSQGRAPVPFPRLVLPIVQDSGLRNVSRLSARGGVEEVGDAPKGGWPAREGFRRKNPT